MSQFIEQLESRQYASMSLSNPAYMDIQPAAATVTGVLNNGHKGQLYMVRVLKAGEIDLALDGLTGDAGLELISDKNHNNRLDSGEVLQKSDHALAANESIRRMIGPGNYQIYVYQDDANSIIDYTLHFSSAALTTADQVDQTGNTIADARDLTVPLGNNRTVNEYIGGSDSADVYKMVVTQTTKYDIRLSNLIKDADMTLTDANGNALFTTQGKSLTQKVITGRLEAGTYYLTVEAVAQPTQYVVRVVASAWRTSDVDLTVKRVALKKALFSSQPITATVALLK